MNTDRQASILNIDMRGYDTVRGQAEMLQRNRPGKSWEWYVAGAVKSLFLLDAEVVRNVRDATLICPDGHVHPCKSRICTFYIVRTDQMTGDN